MIKQKIYSCSSSAGIPSKARQTSYNKNLNTVYSSCKLKTRQDKRQGMKLHWKSIACDSDKFVAPKKQNI